MKFLITFFLANAAVFMVYGQKAAKLSSGDLAPDFEACDSKDDTVRLSNLRGKRVYLVLYRNAGCAVCNLRFHEIERLLDSLPSNRVESLGIYESTVSKLKEYTQGEKFNTKLIANPDLSIYDLYGGELSSRKAFKSIFHGVLAKGRAGSKFFKSKIKQDGNQNRIGAEFIIDERGQILLSHYHRFVGDHLPLQVIKRELEKSP